LSPMAPHICEELWERLGHHDSILKARFPEADEAALQVQSVTLAVQVNGKIRARLEVEAGSASKDIERRALALPEVAEFLNGRVPRKVIVVPERLVNIVG
jgi:leucyl-tRNA synthetase